MKYWIFELEVGCLWFTHVYNRLAAYLMMCWFLLDLTRLIYMHILIIKYITKAQSGLFLVVFRACYNRAWPLEGIGALQGFKNPVFKVSSSTMLFQPKPRLVSSPDQVELWKHWRWARLQNSEEHLKNLTGRTAWEFWRERERVSFTPSRGQQCLYSTGKVKSLWCQSKKVGGTKHTAFQSNPKQLHEIFFFFYWEINSTSIWSMWMNAVTFCLFIGAAFFLLIFFNLILTFPN